MNIAILLLASLSTCHAGEEPRPQDSPAAAEASLGQTVQELDPRIWCLHQDQRGDHWFGSNGNGVYRHDGKRLIHYTKEHGLAGLAVRSFQEDAAGNVFIATNSGVSKFNGETFTTLKVVDEPLGEGWRLDPDDVWLIFDPGATGPCRYDGETLHRLVLPESPAAAALREKFPNLSSPIGGVYTVHKDRRGHIWFGTANVGLCRYDGKTLGWIYEEHLTTTPSGGAFGIRSIFEDRAGDFWICQTRDCFKVSPGAIQTDGFDLLEYTKKPGLPDAQTDTAKNFTYYSSMAQDSAGALGMACGSGGVWKFDGKSVTRYPVGDEAYAMTILGDREGKLWVGTLQQGAFVFGSDGFEAFR